MKWIIPAILCFVIIVIFTVPIFHDAGVDGRVIKVSRTVASDLMFAKHLALKEGKNCGVFFNIGKNTYTVFYDLNTDGFFNYGDQSIKTVVVDALSKGVVYSNFFNVTGAVFNNNTVVFGMYGKLFKPETNKNSIFFISSRDEQDGLKNKAIRVWVDVDGRIDILKVEKVLDTGDLVFEPL